VSAMTEIEWEPCLLEPLRNAAIEKRFSREPGRPGAFMRFFVGSQRCTDLVISLSVELTSHVHIDHDLADLVGLVMSQDNSCRFCFAATRTFLRSLGLSDARIRKIELDLHTADLSEADRAALDFARKVSRSSPLPTEADCNRLRDVGFSDVEIDELAGVLAVHLFFNRISTLPALPPQRYEEMPDRWFFRFISPLVRHTVQRSRRRLKPKFLQPGDAAGPFERVVQGLDGLPIAFELRQLLDAIWEPETLSPRCVSLIFAVIARALGCSVSEEEARALVAKEGLSIDDINGTLTHLASPALDSTERILVRWRARLSGIALRRSSAACEQRRSP